MGVRRLYLVVLMLVIVFQQAGPAQNKLPGNNNNGAPAKEQLEPQLKVNRDALLERGDVVAAGIMLSHDDPRARQILLDALKQSKNSPARMAVCRSLIKARENKQIVKAIEVFIGPLLEVFDTDVADEARLAAEATLIFEYEQIGTPLEKFMTDSSTPVRARVNAIQAVKPRLDKSATIKLIELLEDPDKRVSSEAADALASIGISPGATKEQRQATIEEINEQTDAVFLGNRLGLLEEQKRAMAAELKDWERDYVTLLARMHKNLTDDTLKGKFLAEHLASSKVTVKLWAMEEALRWWKGTARSFPSEQLEPILIALISDPDKDVRLRTAEVLAEVVMLNSTQPLLTQLEIEQDDQVKTKLFVALGWACSSAVSSNSPAKVSPEIKEIRTQTLKWAENFLFDKNSTEKATIGASVIEKIQRTQGQSRWRLARRIARGDGRFVCAEQRLQRPGDQTLQSAVRRSFA